MNKPQNALSLFYFVTYMMGGVFVTYSSIFFKERGLTDSQIGFINTAPLMLILLFSIFVGRLADRASDWKQTIIFGNLISAFFLCFIGVAQGFWPILLVMTFMAAPMNMVQSVADAASLRMAKRLGFSFGTVRAYGTYGFVIISIICGYVIQFYGQNAFVVMLIFFGVLRAVFSLQLPKMRDPKWVPQKQSGFIISHKMRSSLSLWFILPLISTSILLAAHAANNNFSIIVWKDQGIGEGLIGILIAFGAACEGIIMIFWAWFQKRFTARQLIIISGVGAVMRWAFMVLTPTLFGYFLAQFMQSIAFTCAYLGCAYFIANRVEEDIAAEAQSLFQIIQLSITILLVNIFGIIFQQVGLDAYWLLVAFSLVSIALVLWSIKINPTFKIT